MSDKSDNIELLKEWDYVQNFLDKVLNPNLIKSKYKIEDSVLLYMINKLKECSDHEKKFADYKLCDLEDNGGTDEEKDYSKKLLTEWTNVYNSLSNTQTICDNLSREMEKLNKSTTD